MGRLIVLVLAAVALLLWLRRLGGGAGRQAPDRPDADRLRSRHMVRCRHCQVYLPEAEAVRGEMAWYCSAAHCALAEAGPPPDRP